jgi:hypothetical protein
LYSVRIALLQKQQEAEQRRKAKALKKQPKWVLFISGDEDQKAKTKRKGKFVNPDKLFRR